MVRVVKQRNDAALRSSSLYRCLIFYFVKFPPLPNVLSVAQARFLNVLFHPFLCFFTLCNNDSNEHHCDFLFVLQAQHCDKCFTHNLSLEPLKVHIILSISQMGRNWDSKKSNYPWSHIEWVVDLRWNLFDSNAHLIQQTCQKVLLTLSPTHSWICNFIFIPCFAFNSCAPSQVPLTTFSPNASLHHRLFLHPWWDPSPLRIKVKVQICMGLLKHRLSSSCTTK